MTATPALTTDLQKQVRALVDDLRMRVDGNPELLGQWQDEHRRAYEKERTAASWVEWCDDRLDQAAVAWVLATVFIRFCEDNGLVRPVWITGPGRRRQEALDAQREYFQQHPESTDREWLMEAIDYLGSLPATKALVDTHSALRWVSPSGDAVTELLKFWRDRPNGVTLVHDLNDETLSTRFLGDLYQELSAHAQEKYALRQTPIFVEEFILDRTLEPALRERPLENFRIIDPTCGSGHFLLGSFERLLSRWHKQAPNVEIQARVQSALDSIHGVDLNPFAVAIARLRLTVAALNASELRLLEDAPAFRYHLAVGDSLIHGPDADVIPGMEGRAAYMPFHYATEDASLLSEMLEERRYDVVVGNPPYITVKDDALNKVYRSKFGKVCKGRYALTVPFIVQFFALAKRGSEAGWVGVIASKSFTKREFGVPLVESYLPQVDLRLVIDSEGAWIPGHNIEGTPTVIIVGKSQQPAHSAVRAILGKGVRETSEHGTEGKGPYWSGISSHWDDPGWDDNWISVVDLDRKTLAAHPWTLTGGGVVELIQTIVASSETRLTNLNVTVGRTTHTGSDDCFYRPRHAFATQGLLTESVPVVLGEGVRNYNIETDTWTFFPYDENGADRLPGDAFFKAVWPVRTIMESRVDFQQTLAERGLRWYDHSMFFRNRFRLPMSIAFAEVATHNHFVLDYGGKVFKQTAPAIKLSPRATEDDYLKLLGVLNSSAICFWLKQHSQPKGGAADIAWLRTYQVSAATIEEIPLPIGSPVGIANRLNDLAQELITYTPSAVCSNGVPSHAALSAAHEKYEAIRANMITLQEELDWSAYKLYGLIEDSLTCVIDVLPPLSLGERSFEIRLCREGLGDSPWFTENYATPTATIPSRWPTEYSEIVLRRLKTMEENHFVNLLERPEYKRRWEQEPWGTRQKKALQEWLLDRLENRRFWFDSSGVAPKSVAQLADEVTRDPDIVSVLALWEGRPDVPVTSSLTRLLKDEAVPFLAAYRYKDSGLRNREAWEETWDLQRRQDVGENVGTIPVPPTYTSADFRQPSYARARGKLDVPKERFILYPDASREGDSTPLLGWAGWDHAQQALALAAIIQEREQEGWDDDSLTPLVAGLAELEPWIDQWHTEVIPEYTASYATICRQELDERAAQVGKTRQELAAWRPAAPTRGRKKATK